MPPVVRSINAGIALVALAALAIGGGPLVVRLAWRALAGEFGADQLAGSQIVAMILDKTGTLTSTRRCRRSTSCCT